jgi:hypothetical protein
MTSNIPLSTPPVRPANWWKSLPGQAAILAMAIGVIVIALGLFGVIGPRTQANPLATTDPAAASACNTLRDWINGDLAVSEETVMQLVIADTANAHTGDIKRSGAAVSMRIGDLADVHAACVEAGVKMPAYPEGS